MLPSDHPSDHLGYQLASLVTARICHDIVSPLGAVSNGLDLMREMKIGAGRDFDLVEESAGRATMLIRLLRLAFGPAGGDAAPVSRQDIAGRIALLGGKRVNVFVDGADGPPLKAATARLAALMALSARAMVGMEGRVVLTLGSGDLPVKADAFGQKAAWSEFRERLADGDMTGVTPRDIEFLLMGQAARDAGARMSRIREPGRAGLVAQRADSPAR